ncbi:hypothetical protein O1M54_04175 [Streptomyces diastatochromogenes]|nr:hypothetical protein [Streptomyces diastatochromogenes]
MNSRESPGRKKPISRPVSANSTTPTPITPKAASREWASSTLTASCDDRSEGVAIAARPFLGCF